ARVDGLADRPYRLREILHLMHMRNVARLEVHLGDAQVVASDEAEEDLGEESALLAAEAAHDAEIDRDDAARLVDEEIPLVHVGVEKAVAQGMSEEGLNQRPGKRARIVAEGRQALRIGDRNAFD